MVSASGGKATLRNVPWIFLGNRVSMGVERSVDRSQKVLRPIDGVWKHRWFYGDTVVVFILPSSVGFNITVLD